MSSTFVTLLTGRSLIRPVRTTTCRPRGMQFSKRWKERRMCVTASFRVFQPGFGLSTMVKFKVTFQTTNPWTQTILLFTEISEYSFWRPSFHHPWIFINVNLSHGFTVCINGQKDSFCLTCRLWRLVGEDASARGNRRWGQRAQALIHRVRFLGQSFVVGKMSAFSSSRVRWFITLKNFFLHL